ncbi:hypothetical protein L2E82_30533 [Cichorium intybus]|uniref:Uncharacterized protein n=1 Tax=Cichorium intybus TaxID=13427 RepID=A0ACB9D0M8_CICIN|nr:hypothetical protein L2E82_30533 [Cichorium intybus]
MEIAHKFIAIPVSCSKFIALFLGCVLPYNSFSLVGLCREILCVSDLAFGRFPTGCFLVFIIIILPFKQNLSLCLCEGLIVFESGHPTNNDLTAFHVCKPTTNQFQALPDPESNYSTCKAAIVIIGVPEDDCDDYDWYAFEIFDSESWSWREVDTIWLPPSESPTDNKLITSRGKVYMLLDSSNIFKIDAHSEECEIFLSPYPLGDLIHYDHKIFSKHEGNLGFDCHHSNGFWDHWVLTGKDL